MVVIGLLCALAGLAALALGRQGGSSSRRTASTPATTDRSVGGTASSVVTTPPPGSLAGRYLAAAEAMSVAQRTFFRSLDEAQSTPCTCPPGQFEFKYLMPALPPIIAAEEEWLARLDALAADAPPETARDIRALRSIDARELADYKKVYSVPGNPTAWNDWNALDDRPESNQVRRDLGLPLLGG